MTLDHNPLPIAFLGLADAVHSPGYAYPLGGIDIYQLSKNRGCIIFPTSIEGLNVVLMLNVRQIMARNLRALKIAVHTPSGAELFNMDMKLIGDVVNPGAKDFRVDRENSAQTHTMLAETSEWQLVTFAAPNTSFIEPGRYTLTFKRDGTTPEVFDSFGIGYSPSDPLSTEEIAAIESDPLSHKQVRVVLGCNKCSSKLSVYAALHREDVTLDREGHIWQTDVPEYFICECGGTNVALRYLKESLHGLLRTNQAKGTPSLSLERRYNKAHIEAICRDYLELIQEDVAEERVQKFIENNKTLLAIFKPRRLYIKPKILTRFIADFAIVDAQGTLTLIEIERPGLTLFTNKGRPTSQLNNAFGQVRDWLVDIQKHRSAFLDSLALTEAEVSNVRGVVLAGRYSDENKEHLKKHRMVPLQDQIELHTLTYLALELRELARNLG